MKTEGIPWTPHDSTSCKELALSFRSTCLMFITDSLGDPDDLDRHRRTSLWQVGEGSYVDDGRARASLKMSVYLHEKKMNILICFPFLHAARLAYLSTGQQYLQTSAANLAIARGNIIAA